MLWTHFAVHHQTCMLLQRRCIAFLLRVSGTVRRMSVKLHQYYENQHGFKDGLVQCMLSTLIKKSCLQVRALPPDC